MDVLAVTDFPDIRPKAMIQSAGDGNLMIIPREVCYVKLDKLNENERIASRNLAVDDVITAAKLIFCTPTVLT